MSLFSITERNNSDPGSFDNLRAIATVAVIILHVSSLVLYKYNKIDISYWWVGNIIDSSVRFSVPVFLMLSGYFIYNKTYISTKDFYKKRLNRIFLPFIFWSFVYLLLNIYSGTDIPKAFAQLSTGTYYHLWYVYTIIGIYLFMPVIQKWIQQASPYELLFYLTIWLFSGALRAPVISNYVPAIDILYFSGYLGYTVLGFFLGKYKISLANGLKVPVYALGFLATAILTYLVTAHYNKFNGLFYSYLTPNVILMSIGVFTFFYRHQIKNGYVRQALSMISANSFGIYLLHPLILFFLGKFQVNALLFHPIIGIMLTSVLALIISTFTIIGLRKLPYGNYIAG
jgi:surface polysaccharide O-acyltransferase-like enzyme